MRAEGRYLGVCAWSQKSDLRRFNSLERKDDVRKITCFVLRVVVDDDMRFNSWVFAVWFRGLMPTRKEMLST